MGLFDNVHTGAWGTPDFGITEKIQSIFQPNNSVTSQGGSNLFGKAPVSAVQPSTTQSSQGQVLGTSSGGSGGGGGSTAKKGTSSVSAPTQTFDPGADAAARAAAEREDYNRRVAEERSAISQEFDPIFSELDRQLASLPGQKVELEGKVGTLADTQRTGVQQTQDQGITALTASGEEEKANAKGSLRNLEEDVRNQLQARQFFFGSVGAGDSSAPIMASEAISKGALRSRGAVLGARDAGLANIETKKQDVRNLASDQNNKIETWKAGKMLELAQSFQEQERNLSSARANASGAKAKAINDVIRGMSQDLVSELRRLDDQVYQYKSAVSTWQMQREAEMEDYNTKLNLSKSYSSAATPKYSDALNTFNKIYGNGAVSIGEARQATMNQYGIDPLSGLELSGDQVGTKKRSLSDLLGDQAIVEAMGQ